MYEHSNDRTRPPERGAIEISDFVYAATGARLRRLTTPDGEHWFPAVDVCKHLGYALHAPVAKETEPEVALRGCGFGTVP